MRTAIKVMLILAIVGGGISCFCSLIVMASACMVLEPTIAVTYFFSMLTTAASIVLCSVALKKLDDYGTAFAICVLIFASLVAGILMLCNLSNKKSAEKTTQTTVNYTVNQQPAPKQTGANTNIDPFARDEAAEEKLKRLNDMYYVGAITQEEYFQKRNEIISGKR